MTGMAETPNATVVTNTCVTPEHEPEFAAWQAEMSTLVAGFPGLSLIHISEPTRPY